MPEISVVIPTHNRATFLRDAIDSALRQTWRDREILVVDDGSTDGTPDLLEGYGDRIRVIRKEQGGAASARNRGIREARGRWVAFLDSDDLWIDMKLEIQMGLAGRHPEYGWLASSYWKLEGGREFRRTRAGRSGMVFRQVWEENFVRTSTVVARKDCLEKVGWIREDLPINEELDYWLRIARQFPIGYTSRPLAIYRHHPGGVSRDILRSREIYLDLIREHDDPDRISRGAARRRVAYLLGSVGKHRIALDEIETGREALWQAVRTWPLSVKGWRILLRSHLKRPRKAREEGEERPRRSPFRLVVRSGNPVRLQGMATRYQGALEAGGISILREGHRGRVARLEVEGQEIIVKHYRHEGLRDSIRSLLFGSRAVRAARCGEGLRLAGVGAPPVLGVVDRRHRHLPFDSLLVMSPVPGAVEVDRQICRMERDRIRGLLLAFARRIREMHEAGLYHADLKSCNVLVGEEDGAYRFTFLDLEDIRDRTSVPARLRLENLAQLNATVPSWISRSDRMRFFLAVLGRDRLDPEGKSWFRRVHRRSLEKDRVYYDDEGVVRETWDQSK